VTASAYVLWVERRHDRRIFERISDLRAPIPFNIAGQEIELLTIAYVAHSLGRTPWTIRSWQRLGLFPRTPFHIHPAIPHLRRHLFPTQFVDAVAELVRRNHLRERLNRDGLDSIQRDVFEAYRLTVVPLLGGVADASSTGPHQTWTSRRSHLRHTCLNSAHDVNDGS